jgi:hypothetical protein
MKFTAFIRYWRENGNTLRASAVHRLQIVYDSVKREKLYNILVEFWVPMKLAILIKLCLYQTYSEICVYNICLIVFLSKMV